MSDAQAAVSRGRRINPIWSVPILALLLGIWMVVYTIQNEGPEIKISFLTAEGIEAGKTKIKLRNVEVGLVESVRIGKDRESVVVTASLQNEAEELLREKTQFWVVRARIGKGGISGLGTLLGGGYIQIAPGGGAGGVRKFVGLELPPITPAGTPGMRVTLQAERANSVSAGDPVLYKGYTVGRVESEQFDSATDGMLYSIFIDAPYDKRLTTAHRFWDTSGVTFHAGADGIEFDSLALETILIGGVEVGLPAGVERGSPVASGAKFKLYKSWMHVNERPYEQSIQYVVEFAQSVRGLLPGAPVEYRGLHLGQVERIMVTEIAASSGEGTGQAIPVLIRIEPARFEHPDTQEGIDRVKTIIREAVGNGMRASLATGNLLTGSLYVTLDIYPNAKPAELRTYADRDSIPTIASGFEGIQQQLTAFLEKINQLPLEGTVDDARSLLASVDKLVASEGVQAVPASIDETLRSMQETLDSVSSTSELQGRLLPAITELEQTLVSLRRMIETLERQPNALIFNRDYREDPRPPTGSQ